MNYTLWSYENAFETCFIHALQLYKSYPATYGAGHKILLMHTVPPHPNAVPLLHQPANPAGMLWAPPPWGRAITLQLQPALHKECCWFQQDLAGQGFPRCSCVHGLQHHVSPGAARRTTVRRSCRDARQLSAFSAALGWGNFMFRRPKRATNPWPATREAMADSALQCTEELGGLNLHEYTLTTSLCLLLKLWPSSLGNTISLIWELALRLRITSKS